MSSPSGIGTVLTFVLPIFLLGILVVSIAVVLFLLHVQEGFQPRPRHVLGDEKPAFNIELAKDKITGSNLMTPLPLVSSSLSIPVMLQHVRGLPVFLERWQAAPFGHLNRLSCVQPVPSWTAEVFWTIPYLCYRLVASQCIYSEENLL